MKSRMLLDCWVLLQGSLSCSCAFGCAGHRARQKSCPFNRILASWMREALLKELLQHLDEILWSTTLLGYLYIRTRWATLPGEPLPIDVMQKSMIGYRGFLSSTDPAFTYVSSTDLSPHDSTLLSDIEDVGPLPNLAKEHGNCSDNYGCTHCIGSVHPLHWIGAPTALA